MSFYKIYAFPTEREREREREREHSTRIAQFIKVNITLSVYWELSRIVIAPQYSIIIL
jgi:hypothetical protein